MDEDQNLFGQLDPFQKRMVFDGLLTMIKANSGTGFHNSDQGHPAYLTGARDGHFDYASLGDSPEHNRLYKMLDELSEDLRGHREIKEFVNSWQDFCKLGVEAYNEAKGLA